MGNTFTSSGKPTKNAVTAVDRAQLDIKVQKRRLGEYQKRLEASARGAEDRAKEFVAQKNRPRALTELRKKKFLEQNLERVDAQLLRLEETLLSIQEAQHTADVVARLKEGSAALKQLQGTIKVQDVERLMDDISEAHVNLAEVNEVLGEGLTSAEDAEAEMELENLESELLQEALPALPTEQLQMPEKPYQHQQKQKTPQVLDGAALLASHAGAGIVQRTEPERQREEPMLAA